MAAAEQESRHAFLNEALTLAKGALVACMETSGRAPREITERELNNMAGVLSDLVTLFCVSADRQSIKPLAREQLTTGIFCDGGRVVAFLDGRLPISGLILTRTAFKAALAILKDAGQSPAAAREVIRISMSELITRRKDLRRHVAELAARNPQAESRFKYWRTAGRVAIFVLLGFSALQYYFFDVYLTIMTLPQVRLVAALP